MIEKKGIDLLLVNAGGFRKKIYQDLGKDLSAIEPPFWAALTAGFIRKKGFNVKILDANAENLDLDETVKKIESFNPKLINIIAYGQHPSASTPLMPIIGKLTEKIKDKSPELKVILTGLHPSALPKKTMEEEKCDFVGDGEGFYTLLGLLEKKEFRTIPGLWYRELGKIKSTSRSELIKDLDEELSDVAWDLLPMAKYRAHNWHCLDDPNKRMNYASISTTLGCPFNCSFCCINAPFEKNSYRKWSIDWVMEQLDLLVNTYGIKNLKIIDELFILDSKHFIGIANKIIERGYKLNIWAYARVDTINEDDLKILKKAGFNWFALGIESGNENVRKGSQKGNFDKKKIVDAIEKIRASGIYVMGNYVFGLPEDDLETMQETLELAKELNCEYANMYCAMAYPGSQLYSYAKQNKISLPEDEMGWMGYSQHSYETLPLGTKYLSAAEVLRFRDKAFDEYFTNKKYLDMVEKKFGIEARKHIEEMTKIKLRRKLFGDEKEDKTEKLKQEMIDFEEDIREIWEAGKVKGPVHLVGGNEEQLIKIFKQIKPEDWVFSTHRSHYHAFLKGVPKEWIKQEILNSRSISLYNKYYNFFTSAIVGGVTPIALGVAKAIKMKNSNERAWVFVGDMASEGGMFHECVKYARRQELPITFVIEDNGFSTYTPTQHAWGNPKIETENIIRYKYERSYPHQGSGKWVDF